MESVRDFAIANFSKVKAIFYYAEGVFHIRTHGEFTAIGFTVSVAQWSISISASIGKILSRALLLLASSGVAHDRLNHRTHVALSHEANRSDAAVMNVRARGSNRVNYPLNTIDADVSFHSHSNSSSPTAFG